MYFWKYILAKKAGLSQKKCNMALYGLPVLPIAEAFEKTVTGNPISVTDAFAQDALSLQVSFTPTQDGTPSIDSEPTTEPYLSKVVPRGNKEYYSLVGGTVAWNQLVDADTTSVTVLTGHKYIAKINGTWTSGNGGTVSVTGGTDMLTDITLMFANAPAIADYIYSLETSEAGSGIAWLKSYGFFTEDYYAYNPGELISVNTSGHKIGSTTYPIDNIDLRGLFKLSNGKLYCEGDIYPPSGSVSRKYGIVDLGTLTYTRSRYNGIDYFFIPSAIPDMKKPSAHVIANNICQKYIEVINDGVVLPTFVDKSFFVFTDGILYIRDDSYTDATTFKTSMSGVYLVYELATPTTESATPYASPVDVETGGTEEFIDNRTVPIPVGNETYHASEYEIHGKTGVTVSHGATQDDPNPTEHEVEFTSQGTVYGGTVDIVSGMLSVTWGYIASYNGETLTGIWMSSKDVYAEGTTPSTGAEVAYELATPLTYQLTPQQVQMLLGDNYLETEDGTITLTYMAGK